MFLPVSCKRTLISWAFKLISSLYVPEKLTKSYKARTIILYLWSTLCMTYSPLYTLRKKKVFSYTPRTHPILAKSCHESRTVEVYIN